MPRERLRAVLHAGSLDLARLAADGGSIGNVQHAAVTHWPREDDCAALCRQEARTTERGLLTNTSHNTVSWVCLAFIWHAAPSSEGGGKCFLVGTPGSRWRSRAKRRPPPIPVPLPPLMSDAPPPPPMVPCAKLLVSTSGSTSSASSPARRFVLVTSAARVGSNWVRSLLNQHPQLHMEGARLESLVQPYHARAGHSPNAGTISSSVLHPPPSVRPPPSRPPPSALNPQPYSCQASCSRSPRTASSTSHSRLRSTRRSTRPWRMLTPRRARSASGPRDGRPAGQR